MQARHSPAVRYPLPSYRLRLSGLGFVAAALTIWWCVWISLGAGFGQDRWIRALIALVAFGTCTYCGLQAFQRLPQGSLYWSGKAWAWEYGLQSLALPQNPVVLADLQWLLVLAWHCEDGETRRFVLLKRSAPNLWPDLRRAVYSPVHPAPSGATADAL